MTDATMPISPPSKRRDACVRCGEPLPPFERRHGSPRRFCSPECRTKSWDETHPRQHLIDFTPPAEPVQALGPTPAQIRKAQKPQTVKVLRMLQDGPKTTRDFLAAYIGRFGGRIKELRDVGHTIITTKLTEHSALYVLIEPATLPSEECGTNRQVDVAITANHA